MKAEEIIVYPIMLPPVSPSSDAHDLVMISLQVLYSGRFLCLLQAVASFSGDALRFHPSAVHAQGNSVQSAGEQSQDRKSCD